MSTPHTPQELPLGYTAIIIQEFPSGFQVSVETGAFTTDGKLDKILGRHIVHEAQTVTKPEVGPLLTETAERLTEGFNTIPDPARL